MSDLLHPLSLSLLLLFLPFLFFISMASQSDSNYLGCSSYDCNGVLINYPFWRIDNRNTTHVCGYKGFGINCSTIDGSERPIIDLEGHLYYVKNISYNYTSIVLVDYDVSTVAPDSNDCPRVRHEINFANLPFNFIEHNVNLSFHFNCTGIPPFAHPIPCLNYDSRKSCVNIITSELEKFNWSEYRCEDAMVTTVLHVVNSRMLGVEEELRKALNTGFEISWQRFEDCGRCEESDGRCGFFYNKTELIPGTTELMCFCEDGSTWKNNCKGSIINGRVKLFIAAASALVSFVLICIVCCIRKFSLINCVASFKHRTEDDISVEAFIKQYGSLTTRRYKYADVKKMTNSFKVRLGQGGFGTVFKGKLSDGRLVAVKVLKSSKANGQEFINEVASIGKTSHINIVSLLGFCSDNKKRALIYEFMPNGSLEKFIYSDVAPKTSIQIGVGKLYEVALGIARGLDYLHRGCNTRILHIDIKPHNILLDEEFCPKIADFGLAKLYSRKTSIVSMLEARGTIGYIAPEIFNRNFGGVSHKSDVYSYGMLILEMVGGRKNVDAGVGSGQTSEIYFPYWIYNRLEKKEEFLLASVTNMEENDYARKMTIVGLWCIQADPKRRPSISEAIEMLEGSLEALEVPPKPFFASPRRSPVTTLSTSESLSEINVIQH